MNNEDRELLQRAAHHLYAHGQMLNHPAQTDLISDIQKRLAQSEALLVDPSQFIGRDGFFCGMTPEKAAHVQKTAMPGIGESNLQHVSLAQLLAGILHLASVMGGNNHSDVINAMTAVKSRNAIPL